MLNRSPITRLILPIYLPALIFAVGSGALMPVLALAALAAGFSESGSSAAVGVLGFIGILVSPVIGRVITRIGDRSALVWGGILAILASLGFLWTLAFPDFGLGRIVFMIAIVFLGVSSNTWSLARQAYVAESIPAMWRARGLSTLGGMMRIGQLVGPLLATAVLALWEMQAVFVVNMLLALIALTLVLVYIVPENPSRARTLVAQARNGRRARDSREQADDDGPRRPRTPAAAKDKTIGAPTSLHRSKLSTFILAFGLNCLNVLRANRNVIVPLWGTFLGFSPHFITATFAATALFDTTMFIVSGSVMDRRGRHWALLPSLVFMPIGIVVMILWTTKVGFVVGGSILGFGNGFGAGIVMTLGADLSPPENRANFLGIWQSIIAVGTAFGPFVISGLASVTTLEAGLWATAGIGIFGLVWSAALMKYAYARLGTDLRGRPLKPAR